MEAPVVPMRLAITVPKARITVLTSGVPLRLPVTRMPPDTVNKANSRMMKGMYSKSAVCTTSCAVADGP